MILKQFLLGLHLTSGIGHAGEKRVVEVIANHLIPENYPWNIETLLAALMLDLRTDFLLPCKLIA